MTEILTESFCERCGTRYTFESAKPRVRLKGVKVLSRGLKNFVLSDDTSMDEAMAAARSETDREASAHQLDAFHKTFNFCMSCRQYTCPNCWNEVEARCLTCAPLALPETPALADLGDFGDTAMLGHATLLGAAEPQNGSPDQVAEPVSAVVESAEPPAVEQPVSLAEDAVAEAVPVAEPPVEAEAEAAAAPPADAAGKAAAQTTGLLQRFRPGQSLDEELAAFERERGEAAPATEEAVTDAVTETTVSLEVEPSAEDALVGATSMEPEIEAASESIEAEPIFEAGLAAAIEAQATEAVEAESEAAAVVPDAPEASVPEPEPEPLAAAGATDVVEQPTWRITAPDGSDIATPRPPLGGEAGLPLQTRAGPTATPDSEPQWPAQPQWPSSTPAAGLPFLGRPAAPQGGIDALWAASNQELVTAAPAPQGKAASGIQPCISCGLSLSANARFCRRCGTLQGR